jgi:hypothetical protein
MPCAVARGCGYYVQKTLGSVMLEYPMKPIGTIGPLAVSWPSLSPEGGGEMPGKWPRPPLVTLGEHAVGWVESHKRPNCRNECPSVTWTRCQDTF